MNVEGKSAATLAELQQRVVLTPEHPARLIKTGNNWFFDFGKDAFGTLEIELDTPSAQRIELRLGQVVGSDGGLFVPEPRSPECSRRFRRFILHLSPGHHRRRLKIPRPFHGDEYQTEGYDCCAPYCVKCPPGIGEIMPFRYGEIHGFSGNISVSDITRLTASYPFNDLAADFDCSDSRLNEVWELCRHTVKSTTYLGFYVDGDRERLPYEGDILVQQLSHFCLDTEYDLSRGALEWFCELGTSWCYEWVLVIPVLAWRHCLYSGDTRLPERYFRILEEMTLSGLRRADGLLATGKDCRDREILAKLRPRQGFLRDLVDWPPSMRDGYEIGTVNTVANCFHFAALDAMADIAAILKKHKDCRIYREAARNVRRLILERLVDPVTGLFVDSEGSRHSSLHSAIFPLACGITVPDPDSPLIDFIIDKGMSCSVWAAQFLLEALFVVGRADAALDLMVSRGERSWLNMIRQGATMTMESWSNSIKPSQDWNHPWATAPVNIIARHLMGVRPLAPGFEHFLVAPRPGSLRCARITVPTVHGGIDVEFEQSAKEFRLLLNVPSGTTAEISMPYDNERIRYRSVRPGTSQFTIKTGRTGTGGTLL